MSKETKAVILAAGLGTRMKSDTPKVLHHLSGRPMIEYVLKAVRSSGVRDIICVVGHKAGRVKGVLKDVKVIKQKRLLGSADALKQTKNLFKNFTGDILVLYGDAPLIKAETLRQLKNEHKRKNENSCTLLSARMKNPTGYGRIMRDDSGRVAKITEETEASEFERVIDEINVGVYYFKKKDLFSLLREIKNDNKKGEYFLTDIISLMHERDSKVGSVTTDDSDEALGINSRKDLAVAEKIIQKRAAMKLMNDSVTIVDPDTTYIDEDVKIGKDTIIYPHTVIEKDVTIGRNCRIGPFARIRPGCTLKEGVEIGTFVELVRTRVDKNTKVKHQSYIGDTIIGKNVNVGAGTITANYDGKKKYITKIDDGAFIGSGTVLVAPVKVGKKATTGAGTVVTKNHNVPANSVVVGVPARLLKKKR